MGHVPCQHRRGLFQLNLFTEPRMYNKIRLLLKYAKGLGMRFIYMCMYTNIHPHLQAEETVRDTTPPVRTRDA